MKPSDSIQPDPSVLLDVARMKMPFGKFKDQPIRSLPLWYLQWLSKNGMPQGRLGMVLSTALVIRENDLDYLLHHLSK
jgi:uncharacterized protein